MDWWRQMFASPLWQHVQLSWEQADDADEDADRIVAALKLQRGGAVLDVPCGTGRIAKRLRSRGFPTVGVDATSTFLEEARRADVPVILADMRTGVVRPGSFAAAVCFWGSFGYFDDSGNLAQARALANALVRGGRCLIDTVAADSLLSRFEPEGSWDLGDTHVEERRRYDARSNRIETVWTFSRGDVTQRRVSSLRLYTVAEIADLLAGVGFASFQALDGDLEPFTTSSERLWLVATKAGEAAP